MCLTHRDTSKDANLISACHTLFSGAATPWWQTCCPDPSVFPIGLKADPESVHLKNNVVPKSTTTLNLTQIHYSDWMFKDTWHTPSIHTKCLQTQVHTHANRTRATQRQTCEYTNTYTETQTYKCINTNTRPMHNHIPVCVFVHVFVFVCVFFYTHVCYSFLTAAWSSSRFSPQIAQETLY